MRTYLAGAGRDRGLERVVSYLSGAFQVPISVVTFDVFEVGSGERVLVREMTEAEVAPPQPPPGHTVENVCAQAGLYKIGAPFRRILEAAAGHGLFAYPYKASIKYTAPFNHTRSLFTVWSQPASLGQIQIWIGPESFAKLYPVTEDGVTNALGPGGWRKFLPEEVDGFIDGLHRLFAGIEAPAETDQETTSQEMEGRSVLTPVE